MKHLMIFEDYNPRKEYMSDTRRDIDLDDVRSLPEYQDIIALGFKEDTSLQQELNNTIKFSRRRHKQGESGYGEVFYTIHPSGSIRRYNPPAGENAPAGSGNDLYKYPKFKNAKDYRKGLLFLWQYLRRKEGKGNYR